MKAKFFQHVLFTSVLLLALTATGALPGRGKLAFAQPSPQVSSSSEAQPQASPGTTRTSGDVQSDTSSSKKNGTQIPTPQYLIYGIVGGMILLLGYLFHLLLLWSARHEQSSYLGTLFRDTVEEFEYRRFAQPYLEKRSNSGYQVEANQDPTIRQAIKDREEQEKQSAGAGNQGHGAEVGGKMAGSGSGGSGGGGTGGTGGTGSGFAQEVEYQAKLKYEEDLKKAREQAKARAMQAANVDLNVLRGRGAEFVLEFTAVVILVFAVTILGLLQVLESQPISTLLAAIAGYVLGRASTRRQGDEGARAGISTAEVTELIRAVTGVTKPPSQPPQKEPEEGHEVSPSASAEPSR